MFGLHNVGMLHCLHTPHIAVKPPLQLLPHPVMIAVPMMLRLKTGLTKMWTFVMEVVALRELVTLINQMDSCFSCKRKRFPVNITVSTNHIPKINEITLLIPKSLHMGLMMATSSRSLMRHQSSLKSTLKRSRQRRGWRR